MEQITDVQIWAIILACLMMVADVIVGFIQAVINRDVSSTKMRTGLLHKLLIFILIIVCLAIEIGIRHAVQLPYDVPTCEVVCGYVIVMELMSILENIAKGDPGIANTQLFRLFKVNDTDERGKDA